MVFVIDWMDLIVFYVEWVLLLKVNIMNMKKGEIHLNSIQNIRVKNKIKYSFLKNK